MKRRREATAEDVLGVIDQLERWRETSKLAELWPCRHCGANVGEPCRRPDGTAFDSDRARIRRARSRGERNYPPARPLFHRPRLDRAMDAYNGLIPIARRQDMLVYGDPPERVLAKVRRSRLYRRLVELGRLTENGGAP